MQWKDVTTYGKYDKERIPTTFEVVHGVLRICITCGHIIYRPDWVMHCFLLNIDSRVLKAKNKDDAEIEALAVVEKAIDGISKSFAEIKQSVSVQRQDLKPNEQKE